jgi:predicted deacetylase
MPPAQNTWVFIGIFTMFLTKYSLIRSKYSFPVFYTHQTHGYHIGIHGYTHVVHYLAYSSYQTNELMTNKPMNRRQGGYCKKFKEQIGEIS